MAEGVAKTAPTATAEDAALAAAAARGEGEAFAGLYERYERRAYNLAYRVTGSEADAADATQEAFLNVMRRLPEMGERELAFGSYLFTSTRNACYDLMERRRRAQPSDSIAETAVPVGVGAADPGDPEHDPDRRQLLSSQQEEIRAANGRLPERQREVLALRELEELSYDEIAEIMGMNRNSVAQLISRARIGLRDELRGAALAAVAAAAPECERALPLIAMRDDGQLAPESEDGAWLAAHLAACERCPVAVEAMQEAGTSYRAWAPVAAAPWLLRETMARAAMLAGADWSEEIEAALAGRAAAGGRRRRRRLGAVLAGAAVLLLGGGLATVLAGGETGPTGEEPRVGEEAAAAQAGTTAGSRRPSPSRAGKPTPGRTRTGGPQPSAGGPPTSDPATEAETAEAPPAESEPTSAAPSPDQKPARSAPPERRAAAVGGGRARGTQPEPRPEPRPEPPNEPAPEPEPPPEEPPPPPETTAEPPREEPPDTTEPPREEPPPEDPQRGRDTERERPCIVECLPR